MAGVFITVEGVEGSGKTTQIRILEEQLRLRGHQVLATREPGGTAIGERIRAILLDSASHDLRPLTELLLYEAARCQHVDQVIRPALATGAIVLCDRFTDATCAYQGAARELDPQLIAYLNGIAADGLTPDLTLLFDCPVEIGLTRARERMASGVSAHENRFEEEALAFHERVREGYMAIAAAHPARVRIINAADDVESIRQAVLQEVMKILP